MRKISDYIEQNEWTQWAGLCAIGIAIGFLVGPIFSI